MTALTSELTSELILRRKQYEYYREKLLSEEELGKVGFEWKPLGEVTNIKTGQAVSKYSISQNPGIYPVINSGREPLGFINEWNTENDPIGITTRGDRSWLNYFGKKVNIFEEILIILSL